MTQFRIPEDESSLSAIRHIEILQNIAKSLYWYCTNVAGKC